MNRFSALAPLGFRISTGEAEASVGCMRKAPGSAFLHTEIGNGLR